MNLNRFARLVRQRCLVAGAEGEPRSYGEIAESMGLSRSYRPHLRVVERALKAILRDDHEHGRPLACVAAIRAEFGVPGWGFATISWELGIFTGGDYRSFVAREWERLRRYCATLRILDGPVESPGTLPSAG